MKVTKYTKLGILIFASIAIFIWGLSYLKGNDIFSSSDEYHVIYERVDGLSESNDIVLSGYKIGQVKNIQFLPDHSGRLLVTFMIDGSVKLPENTVAQIVSSDLMGNRSIKINLGTGEDFYSNNDTIPGDVEDDLKEQVSMQVLPLKHKAEELLGTLDSAITVLTVIFNEDARKNLSESFENINQTILNIENATADLQKIVASEKENVGTIVSNLEHITTTFSRNTSEFEKTLQNLSAFSDTLAQIQVSPLLTNILEASGQINTLLASLESTDNTAGLLLNDDELYRSIELMTDNLNLLMTDIRVNPERYLNFSALDFGRKVYINAPENAGQNTVFKIHLVSSENRIPLDSKRFSGLEPVEEIEVSGAYTYLTGETNSVAEIMELQKTAFRNFPNATIVAFRNGRLIKLEKALKSLR